MPELRRRIRKVNYAAGMGEDEGETLDAGAIEGEDSSYCGGSSQDEPQEAPSHDEASDDDEEFCEKSGSVRGSLKRLKRTTDDDHRDREKLSRRAKAQITYNDDWDVEDLEGTLEATTEDLQKEVIDAPTEVELNVPKLPYLIPEGIEQILGCKHQSDDNQDYFYCKLKHRAYKHCVWLTAQQVRDKGGKSRLKNFLNKRGNLPIPEIDEDNDNPEEEDMYFDLIHTEVDRIVALQLLEPEEEGGPMEYFYLVKWRGLPYDEATWEPKEDLNAPEKMAAFERRFDEKPPPIQKPTSVHWSQNVKEKLIQDTSERLLHGRKLRAYQEEGFTWMVNSWLNNRSVILGDEMGLGKTVQVISFMLTLIKTFGRNRCPFLVVAPLSTISHWEREINTWTMLNGIVFHGNELARNLIEEYEFYFNEPERQDQYKFDVLITTYETATREADRLRKVPWETLTVDEGHRLKNRQSVWFNILSGYNSKHRLVLTGTPVQNNMKELFTLLHFVQPQQFRDEDEFLHKYGQLDSESLKMLQAEISPFLLRREKSDVGAEIPPKTETLIRVRLSWVQKMHYKAIYEGNRDFLVTSTGSKAILTTALNNIVMQLRKVCNHPYLLPGAEQRTLGGKDPSAVEGDVKNEQLIKSSTKLVLLDKLLAKLKEDNHKVLIFSQMTKMLDILEDYLQYRKFKYERLDGKVMGQKRQQCIDRFQDDALNRFVFLLSTKAGGVGINLTNADTCIIYDSDWNPQNDLQAQARCHRIGQDKDVKVYRLLTEDTYEEKMFEVASKKLGLDRAVLSGQMASSSSRPQFTADQMNMLLRHGAYELYKENEDEQDKILWEEDIDKILEKTAKQIHIEDPTTATTPDPNNNEAAMAISGLNSFSTAHFSVSDSGADISMDDKNFWQKILPPPITVGGIKGRIDSGEELDTGKAAEIYNELKQLVNAQFACVEFDADREVEKELLAALLQQLATHPAFKEKQKDRFKKWEQKLTNGKKRRGASRKASQHVNNNLHALTSTTVGSQPKRKSKRLESDAAGGGSNRKRSAASNGNGYDNVHNTTSNTSNKKSKSSSTVSTTSKSSKSKKSSKPKTDEWYDSDDEKPIKLKKGKKDRDSGKKSKKRQRQHESSDDEYAYVVKRVARASRKKRQSKDNDNSDSVDSRQPKEKKRKTSTTDDHASSKVKSRTSSTTKQETETKTELKAEHSNKQEVDQQETPIGGRAVQEGGGGGSGGGGGTGSGGGGSGEEQQNTCKQEPEDQPAPTDEPEAKEETPKGKDPFELLSELSLSLSTCPGMRKFADENGLASCDDAEIEQKWNQLEGSKREFWNGTLYDDALDTFVNDLEDSMNDGADWEEYVSGAHADLCMAAYHRMSDTTQSFTQLHADIQGRSSVKDETLLLHLGKWCEKVSLQHHSG